MVRPQAAPDFGRFGGPEGKLRGRPPPPVEPRSGPWRRTGSESGAGRARTRRLWSMTQGRRGLYGAKRVRGRLQDAEACEAVCVQQLLDRKSTRLNSSHSQI